MSFGHRLTDVVNGWLAVAPNGNPASRQLQKLHDEWIRSEARMGTTYYATCAEVEWLWPDDREEPREFCLLSWEFERFDKRRTHAVTATGYTSIQAFHDAAMAAGGQLVTRRHTDILTTRKPKVPAKPKLPAMIRGNLRDFW
jgi:hypothetical protein